MTTQAQFDAKELLPAVSQAASTVNGTTVDLQPYLNSGGKRQMKAILNVGSISSGTTLDCKIQEGNASNGSDAADITGAAFTQVTTVTGQQEIHFKASKRYVRAVCVTVGTAYVRCCILLAERRYR